MFSSAITIINKGMKKIVEADEAYGKVIQIGSPVDDVEYQISSPLREDMPADPFYDFLYIKQEEVNVEREESAVHDLEACFDALPAEPVFFVSGARILTGSDAEDEDVEDDDAEDEGDDDFVARARPEAVDNFKPRSQRMRHIRFMALLIAVAALLLNGDYLKDHFKKRITVARPALLILSGA